MPTARLRGVGFIPDSPHSGGPVGLGCEGTKWRKWGEMDLGRIGVQAAAPGGLGHPALVWVLLGRWAQQLPKPPATWGFIATEHRTWVSV